MALRSTLKRIERGLRGELDSFRLQNGSTYYFEPGGTYSELFIFDYRVHCGESPDPPEILRKVREAKDVRGALAKLERARATEVLAAATGPLEEIVDIDVLVNERRLAVIEHAPPEDLSE
jgi:hypothetical protein